jgi:hypothetical protein
MTRDEMSIPGPDRRCERKYPLSAGELLELRWWQRNHGHGFARAYPSRDVHNVYFDSPDWDCYAENRSGASRRTKCRLRWYGDPGAAEVATFEAKHRRHAVGHKRQQRVPMSALGLASLPIAGLYRRLRPLLPSDLKLWLDQGHRPVLYDRYRREYYATSAGVRMTVDTGIVYATLHGGPLGRLRLVAGATPAVLEIKYPFARRREAEEALRHLPFRATRCSKYVLGIGQVLSP